MESPFPYTLTLTFREFFNNVEKLKPGDVVTIACTNPEGVERKTVKEEKTHSSEMDDAVYHQVYFTDGSSINGYDAPNKYDDKKYTFSVEECQGSSCSIMGGYRRKSRRSSKRRISRKRKSHRKRRSHRRRKH